MFLLQVVHKLWPIFIICKFHPLGQTLGVLMHPSTQPIVKKFRGLIFYINATLQY